MDDSREKVSGSWDAIFLHDKRNETVHEVVYGLVYVQYC